MSQAGHCPAQWELRDFQAGSLDDARARAIREHLPACAACREVVERLDATGLDGPVAASNAPIDNGRGESPNTLIDVSFTSMGNSPPSTTRPEGEEGADDSESLPPEINMASKRLGKYEIQGVIGHGGMGVVLRGFDTALHRVVAIKVLNRQLASSPTARRRFQREARASAAISHPNVVTIHAVEEHNGLPYLIMEYIDGGALSDRIRAGASFKLMEVLRLGAQIAAGLAAAHAQGVIHRDIKPSNIMCEDGVGRVKITDFGLARVAMDNSELTSGGQTVGTPAYMSPEQVRGLPVDARSDLFSLGCLLYAMVARRSPFRAPHSFEAARKVMDHTPPPLHEVDARVPRYLSEIVAQLLEKKPDDRFQSASEVADLLTRHLAMANQARSDQLDVTLGEFATPKSAPPPGNWRGVAMALVVMLLFLGALSPYLLSLDWDQLLGRTGTKEEPIGGSLGGPRVPDNSPIEGFPPGNSPIGNSPFSEPSIAGSPLNNPLANPPGQSKLLTVSQAGSGQFKTIGKALAAAELRDTIRILDGADYRESLKIGDSLNHVGLRIESPQHARIVSPDPKQATLEIFNVSDVAISGLRLEGPTDSHAVFVHGTCRGIVVEDCDVRQGPEAGPGAAIHVFVSGQSPSLAPISVRNCRIDSLGRGQCVWVHGSGEPAACIELRGNRFRCAGSQVVFAESARKVIVERNLFLGGSNGINIDLPVPMADEELHIVNNTFFGTTYWIGLLHGRTERPVAVVCNNLILDSQRMQGAIEDWQNAAANWQFQGNVWETAATGMDRYLPIAEEIAKLVPKVELISRDAADPGFLRPVAGSFLFSAGAGPPWPKFVGALGDEGDEADLANESPTTK